MDATKTIAALFDFDGVIMDTESQCSNCLCSIHKHLLPLNVKRCIYIGAKFRIING